MAIGTETESETDLVERARKGDRPAFGALVSRYASPLAAFAARHVRTQEEARDVSQAVLLRALEMLPTLREPASFRGWVYGIALNECRRRQRSLFRLRRAVERWSQGRSRDDATPAEPPASHDAVHAALAALPLRQRLAVELRIWEGLTCEEAALALGCTPGTIKANFHHALAKLRSRLGREVAP
jgi:RNA polymerase sigma-70 factor (ECF subfamily)